MERNFIAIMLALCLLLAGCDNYPRDMHHSLQEIKQRKLLKVGVVEHRPWAYRSDEKEREAAGLEARLISDFAQELEAEVVWYFLPEAEAADKLQSHEIHLVVGGLVKSNPRSHTIAFTRPYFKADKHKKDKKAQHVMAVPKGENRLMMTLEKFLKSQEKKITRLYEEIERRK